MRLEKYLTRGRPGKVVYPFSKLPREVENSAGGKGRALARLTQGGFPVPDGCVLLPEAFDGDELTAEAWELVKGQLRRLRGGKMIPLAVRSSALSEDSAQASFAGEFESVLNVQSDEEIRKAVRVVRASRHAARVEAYSQAQGLRGAEHSVAVVIQKMVQPDFSGVLFTADPLTGNLMQMSGNFVTGLGDKLVSGQVSAAEFTFARPEGGYAGPAELSRAASSLHREAHEIEHELGCPQDIEWAVAGGKVFILQARPITTLNPYNPITAEWNDTLKGNFLWSATNLMEAQPEVLTPFTASLRPYLDSIGGPALTVKGYPLNGIIGGRFYSNISVQVSAFVRAFKGDAHRAYRELAGWWGQVPDEMDIPLLPLTKQEWEREMLPYFIRSTLQFASYRRKQKAFLAGNRAALAGVRLRVEQVSGRMELAALWRKEISVAYRDAVFHIVAASSDAQVRLEADLRKLVGAEDANALLSNLGGLSATRLESLGLMAGLGLVLNGKMSREAYLENYGHRGENEGETAWPRPMDDPTWLDRQLEAWAKNPVDIEAMLARQRAAYEVAWERLVRQQPKKVGQMRWRLNQAAKGAQTREIVRSEATRGMAVIRAWALRAGELLEIGDDVFFLTIDEVLAALEGNPSTFELIPVRKEVHARYRALPPYPTLICARFDPFAWAADHNRRSDIFDSRAQAALPLAANTNLIHGAAGALGVVEGTVRKLDCLSESDQFQPGEVLVTTMTNIGWTPIFPRAAAIVTDLGAPLSHAAIVARELGIPAVVGCGDATSRLQTGDRVRVNGGQGLVEIIG
ncbi:MAG: pyruvate, phosphate dikinase [Chloroflexi bacterium HGW-Chloroflexi-6]|nr:MAG: pyruvate, phosphate dikinase [Chloroflexi bacterium HGW-Chloroflexi-6]